MHTEAFDFVSHVKYLNPDFFEGRKVCEIGSRNINGTVRILFENCDYLGIDAVQGVGVDVVTPAHLFESDPGVYDVVISCECFEHDSQLEKTLDKMIDLLRVGGLFISTHASPLRPEHGTRRADGFEFSPDDFYNQTLSIDVFKGLLGGRLEPVHFLEGQGGQDVYCWGFKC